MLSRNACPAKAAGSPGAATAMHLGMMSLAIIMRFSSTACLWSKAEVIEPLASAAIAVASKPRNTPT